MPQGDKTGPSGKGPRTGRGMGNCKPKTSKPTQSKNSNKSKQTK